LTRFSIAKKLKEGYRLLKREEFEDYLDREFKKLMRKLVESTIQAEFEEQIKAGRYKRDKRRRDVRNGYYYRDLFTKFCHLENIKIPRARKMKIEFSAFDKWQRMTYGFKDLVLDLILTGSSYGKIEEFLAKEFTFLSSQSISRIFRELKSELRKYKTAPIEDNIVILYRWIVCKDKK